MNTELKSILEKFAQSGWDLIDEPSKTYLLNQSNKQELIAAIESADSLCGSCGCEFDPLYKKALEILNN